MVVAGLAAGLLGAVVLSGLLWMIASYFFGARRNWENGSKMGTIVFWIFSALLTLGFLIGLIVVLSSFSISAFEIGLLIGFIIFGIIALSSAYNIGAYRTEVLTLGFWISLAFFILGIIGTTAFLILLIIFL